MAKPKLTLADLEALGHTLHDCQDCSVRKASLKDRGRKVHRDVVAFLKKKRKLEKQTKNLSDMKFK